MASPRIAIFPGSFDPPTLGHLDLITRATRLFDGVIVALLRNTEKQPLFPLQERVAMLRDATAGLAHVEVEAFDGLLVEYARDRRASVILRGIRSGADLDYERQLAGMNRHLDASIDTVFLTPAAAYSHISSTLVREIVRLGGPIGGLVPPAVEARIAAAREALRMQKL